MVTTKTIDGKEIDLEGSDNPKKAKFKLFCIRASFLLAWLGFSIIIFIIAILIDIDWMRPSVEQVISQSIHRNIKLGRLDWSFGLHGFSITTSRLLIAEKTGAPFLMAGDCEIGFSLWPLLIGKGKVQYINMQKPLFMAIHLSPNSWNFDDMLVSSDVDLIQIENGHIFVVDRQASIPQRFSDTELNNVQIKLERAGHFSPAQTNIAFSLTNQNTNATLAFNSKVWGDENKPWWEKKCFAEFESKRLTVQNWQTIMSLATVDSKNQAYPNSIAKLISVLPQFSISPYFQRFFTPSAGRFDFHITADGIPNKKIESNLRLKADDIIIGLQNNTRMQLPSISITSQLDLTPSTFVWTKCVVRLPDYRLLFNMAGSNTIDLDKKQRTNKWSFIGLLGDLKKLSPLFVSVNKDIPNNIFGTKDLLANLNGKLLLDLRFDAEKNKEQYKIEANANSVNIDGVRQLLSSINKLVFSNSRLINPLQTDYCKQLNLSKYAKFSGTVIGQTGQGLILRNCSLQDNEVSWKVSGKLDAEGQWQDLSILNDELPLNYLSLKINQDADFSRQVKAFMGLNSNSKIDLSGKASVLAKMVKTKHGEEIYKANEFICEVKFDNAELKLSQPHIDMQNLNGLYTTSSNNLNCKNIHFKTGNSDVNIDASMSINREDPLHFNLQAKNINIVDLREILSLFHFEISSLDKWHFMGKLAFVDLRVSGTTKLPTFIVTAYPADVICAGPALKQPVHLIGGKLNYVDKIFSMDKVTLSTANNKHMVSLVLNNAGNTERLEKLNLRIVNADLNDLQSYLTAAHLPDFQLEKKFQIFSAKGGITGYIDYIFHPDKSKLNGIIEFDGLSFRYGQQKILCKNLKGKALLSNTDILLQDVSGNIDNTPVSLHGRLEDFTGSNKDKSLRWHGEVSAQVAPDNLNNFSAAIVPVGQRPYINLQTKKPIFIKIKTYVRSMSSAQSFVLIADADAGLSISAGDMTFKQPAKKLTISGVCTYDDQKLLWRNLNFDFPDASLSAQGTVTNYNNNKLDPSYDLQMQTSDFIPANYIGQIFSNGIICGELAGQVKANLYMQGTAKSPLLAGKIYLADISIPDIYLDHMVGIISFQPSQGGCIPALLQMDKFNLGPVHLTKASGLLSWQNDLSQLSLKNLKANLASGQFTSDTLLDLKTKKMHLNINVNDANLTQLWPQITSSQIKAAGSLDSNLSIDTSIGSAKELEKNMVGSGHLHAIHGSFSRLSQFHAKLNQVNLIRQGLFGFNVNNVMQSVLPSKASEFDSIDSAFALDQQILTIRHILYDGKDVKFSAAGKVNLALHTLDLDIAGITPRVSNSVLGGKLGELSREITLQKLLDGITMHKLEKLPALPLIGGIAGGPEVFTCKIVSPYDQPGMISQSIQKSFHWLHGR